MLKERLLTKSVEDGESPKYLIMENVKALVGKKFIKDFEAWIFRLSELGYETYWKVINAADYGIPQKRESNSSFNQTRLAQVV